MSPETGDTRVRQVASCKHINSSIDNRLRFQSIVFKLSTKQWDALDACQIRTAKGVDRRSWDGRDGLDFPGARAGGGEDSGAAAVERPCCGAAHTDDLAEVWNVAVDHRHSRVQDYIRHKS